MATKEATAGLVSSEEEEKSDKEETDEEDTDEEEERTKEERTKDEDKEPFKEHPGGGWKVFGQRAINAYDRLMEESAEVGAVTQLDGVGSRVAPKQYPGAVKGKRFELNYDKPDGALVITRSFLPVDAKKVDEVAKAHVPTPCVDSKEYKKVYPNHVAEMALFIGSLRIAFITVVKSTVNKYLMDKIAELGFFSYQLNRTCTTPTEVFKAYNSQEPALSFIGKIFILYFEWWDEMKDQVTYECMMKMNLWVSPAKVPQNAKRVSCLSSIFALVLRQFRNVYSRDDRITHGVRLTISVGGGGREKHKMPRRKKEDGFIPALMVQGWNGEKHQNFNKTIKAADPVSLQEAITNYEAEQAKRPATLPHGTVSFSCSVFMTCYPSAN